MSLVAGRRSLLADHRVRQLASVDATAGGRNLAAAGLRSLLARNGSRESLDKESETTAERRPAHSDPRPLGLLRA